MIPRPRGVGSVDIVPATLAGIPGAELLAELQDYFDQRREIAVDLRVRAPKTVTVDVAVRVEPREGWDRDEVLAETEAALRGRFTGEMLGRDVLRAELGHIIYSCGGVANYALTAPTSDVTVGSDVLPVLGRLTVEGMT